MPADAERVQSAMDAINKIGFIRSKIWLPIFNDSHKVTHKFPIPNNLPSHSRDFRGKNI
jgi:hypothetical protein